MGTSGVGCRCLSRGSCARTPRSACSPPTPTGSSRCSTTWRPVKGRRRRRDRAMDDMQGDGRHTCQVWHQGSWRGLTWCAREERASGPCNQWFLDGAAWGCSTSEEERLGPASSDGRMLVLRSPSSCAPSGGGQRGRLHHGACAAPTESHAGIRFACEAEQPWSSASTHHPPARRDACPAVADSGGCRARRTRWTPCPISRRTLGPRCPTKAWRGSCGCAQQRPSLRGSSAIRLLARACGRGGAEDVHAREEAPAGARG